MIALQMHVTSRNEGSVPRRLLLMRAVAALACWGHLPAVRTGQALERESRERVTLPPPQAGSMAVEDALRIRRSVRDFIDEPLALAEVAQLLWAAQGITHPMGFRTAPSAGALYPLETYLAAGNVTGLPAAVYRYAPERHALTWRLDEDRRAALSEAAFGQAWIAPAAAVIVLSAVAARTTAKYGDRGIRYTHIEAGHAAQNVYLQAAALNLGTTVVGAFDDARVRAVLGMVDDETPLCLLPVGRM
jgi:SagB-type dehydrogenase family enzyme